MKDILGGYHRRQDNDGKTTFDVLLGIKPRSSIETPRADYMASDSNMTRDLAVATVMSHRA